MNYLDQLPVEVLERILKNILDPVDLYNCSRAHHRLAAEIRRVTITRSFSKVLPCIIKELGVRDTLNISNVCRDWQVAVENFDNHVPGRQPYNDQLYLIDMKTLRKDPAEHKWKTDIWFLSFLSLRDVFRFKSVLRNRPKIVPFAMGESARFEITLRRYHSQNCYLYNLQEFLKEYGQSFSHVKLRFTENYRVEYPEVLSYISCLLEKIPKALSVEIEGNFTGRPVFAFELGQPLIPPLAQLESLSLSLGMDNTRQYEGIAVARHANKLKKLKLTARSGNLPQQMPKLLELYLHGIYSEKIFEDLKKLEAPNLQKLTLEIIYSFRFCHSDKTDLMEKIAHLSLRQLIIKCPTDNLHVHRIFNHVDSKLGKLQISSLHTLTIYNYPGDWLPFLVYFPSLTYLNIRITNPGTMGMDAQRILQNRDDEVRIKRILYGENEELVQLPPGTDNTTFSKLEQISVEMWENYEDEVPGNLVHSKIWTRDPDACFSLNECIN